MDPIQTLPPLSSLSSSLLSFLNEKLNADEDLAQAPNRVSELQTQCRDLEQTLINLRSSLESRLLSYASFSDRIGGLFGDVNARLIDLSSLTRSCGSLSGGGEINGRKEQILGQELPALAKEVARVETVRAYAETALKLDALVGDIEDGVSAAINKNRKKNAFPQNSDEMRLLVIKALKNAEDILTSVTKTRPQWSHLVSAVDDRVDRALAILRPQAIADHRALLASLGWPPPLSALTSLDPATRKTTELPNCLFTMQGDRKHQYCENFLALCNLQELQRQRKSRQLEGQNREVALHQPLWAIEELVNPISVASQQHFSKWIEKPEFIFALVYKITRDYVDSMDELLQPLVDEAMLTGYSCREEWISAMVTSLFTYLAKEIFPTYVDQLGEESDTGARLQARISWLHLVDLMIAFDKRIHSLASQSGISISIQEDGNSKKISSLSVFCDRPDWLELWAEIELCDTLEKLKLETDNERNWTMKVPETLLLSGPEDYKSPAISSVFLRRLSLVVERCKILPTISLRSSFIKLVGVPIVHKFLDCSLSRCQEAEGLTALTDNDALIKVANSINAARYFGSVLKEWSEDVFFLEMGLDQADQLGLSFGGNGDIKELIGGSDCGIFEEDITKLENFRKEWVEKISIVVLRGFDARCRDYIKNKRQWQEKSEDGWTVSKSLVEALDYIQGKLSILEEQLNGIDFVGLWRSLAASMDRLIFNGILMSSVKFCDDGVERLGRDLEFLFGVFGAWCLRPEGFFPKVSEGLKLLKMGKKQLEDRSVGGEKWMLETGLRHLTVTEAEKIVNSRVFMI
ncbi:hypothetical protein HS088_TW15G00193 [Tripterygium wilfordii]|uniref:RINT1-like protein MAG2 n=1 Tax=Tripterygium wilfordii TaxID=458696 RepID=A0A7J7CL06_TRIWF|nr:RINT1-like protein MAG2 [Tripterygium wilfordii]KAF5734701.1 hypothetical protein HS088_TW15G00193 [Tripterygium wilfordii]